MAPIIVPLGSIDKRGDALERQVTGRLTQDQDAGTAEPTLTIWFYWLLLVADSRTGHSVTTRYLPRCPVSSSRQR